MIGAFIRFWKDRSGATAIEYAMIGVLIAVAIISGAASIGTAVNGLLSAQASNVTSAGS